MSKTAYAIQDRFDGALLIQARQDTGGGGFSRRWGSARRAMLFANAADAKAFAAKEFGARAGQVAIVAVER